MSGRRAIRWRSIKIGIVVSLTTETLSKTKIVSFLSCLTAYDTCIVKKKPILIKGGGGWADFECGRTDALALCETEPASK